MITQYSKNREGILFTIVYVNGGGERESRAPYQQQDYQPKQLYSQVLQQTHQQAYYQNRQAHQQNPSSTTYLQHQNFRQRCFYNQNVLK